MCLYSCGLYVVCYLLPKCRWQMLISLETFKNKSKVISNYNKHTTNRLATFWTEINKIFLLIVKDGRAKK